MGHAMKPLPPTAAEVRYLHVGPGGERTWREPRCAGFHLGGGSPTRRGAFQSGRTEREKRHNRVKHQISTRGGGGDRHEPDSGSTVLQTFSPGL